MANFEIVEQEGLRLVRIYQGTGKVLFAPIPYWKRRLFGKQATGT